MTRNIILIASLILFFVNMPAFAFTDLDTLRGLQGVYIIVDLSPNIKQHGLTEEQIKTDTEIKLRAAGIRAISQGELSKEAGAPILSISATTYHNPALRGLTFSVRVDLQQLVMLKRDPTVITHGITWSEAATGFVAKDKVQQIRDAVKDHIDNFINAYLTANPKK